MTISTINVQALRYADNFIRHVWLFKKKLDRSFFYRVAKLVLLWIDRSLTEMIVHEKFSNDLDAMFASGGEKGRASRYRSSSGTRCDSQTCFPSITSPTFYLPILVTALVDRKNDSRYRFELLSSDLSFRSSTKFVFLPSKFSRWFFENVGDRERTTFVCKK